MWEGSVSGGMYERSDKGRATIPISERPDTMLKYQNLLEHADKEEPPPIQKPRGKPKKTKDRNLFDRLTKHQDAVHKVVIDLLQSSTLPKKTITFDIGTEFAYHQQIAEDLGVQVYFANPYHSWERGLNENTNGLIRQFIPQKQNLKEQDEKVIAAVQENLNNRPRKSLGFLTPIEFYQAADKKTKSVAFET